MAIAVPVAVVAVAVIITIATLMLFIYKHKKSSTIPCKLTTRLLTTYIVINIIQLKLEKWLLIILLV